jgi:hypothetical protein
MGKFKLSGQVTVNVPANGGVMVQGAGRQLCKFILSTNSAGITIQGGTPDFYTTPQIVLHDLSIAPAVAMPTGTALKISFAGGSGSTDPVVDLRNISVKPTGSNNWVQTGLRLTNVRNSTVDKFDYEGRRNGGYPTGTVNYGIWLDGDSQPVEVALRDINTYTVDTGIYLSGTYQGITIDSPTCVACRVGIAATATDNEGVWLRIRNGDWNVKDFAVQSINIANVYVTGSLAYLNEVGASLTANPACFSVTMLSNATMYAKLTDNHCDGAQRTSSTNRYGVLFSSSAAAGTFNMKSMVTGNSFQFLDYGVVLQQSASVHVGHNQYAGIRVANVFNGNSQPSPLENSSSSPRVTLPFGNSSGQ